MAWYDTHQAAVDPDNPAANEQITFDEWNAMVTYLKDKIIDKTVNTAAIGNDKVLVYKTATSTFVFEAQTGGAAAINDLTDVTISGVPADNEVLAYDTGTSEWINQTAAEAGLATTTDLTAYLALTGGTMAGTLNMGDFKLDGVDDIQAYDTAGIRFRDSAAASKITLATTTYSFTAIATGNMGSYNIINVLDPTSAQHASTKNYDDTHVATKELVTSFTDGYGLVYKTASGKFEMEGIGNVWTGLADTPSSITAGQVVRGNAGGTAIEFSGILETDYLLRTGARTMTADLDFDGHNIRDIGYIEANDAFGVTLRDAANTVMARIGYSSINQFEATIDMNTNDIDDIGAVILNDATELTIASGVVTVTQSYHTIDTEADAATDDLTTIQGGTAGQILVIRAADSARTVAVQDGSVNIQLEGAMSLDNTQDTLTLIYDGTYWLEISRANNGA